ncbi:ATP adenylyltransferase (5',5'''-P-1,P-4-tetraphosphate phosphorylase II) [Hahella chejuensis KCTC 2396]|uniref:ATP adenylyltransferase (5',5'''-P-1,P-4-tetraphosphate phosphorylase II) n=1 Tax=Hahella chejuensis (strain KCTC 2396) TaxID=349521 RepID=Q2S7T7_HAHCH|nr:DUF4922 domain-containing protein [Hahella chejuensis]ABC33287.1 ATP adenylyltransferase (5',5'''-P-1,P-4-tetraphosphate phosphorylase II) [Hahella chejuensis KCTC 2396]
MSSKITLTQGALPERLRLVSQSAQASGALVSLPTREEVYTDEGVPFVLRLLTNLERKNANATLQEDGSAPQTAVNPFLPYDEALYIGHINNDYVCLLNKFNVLPNHFLMVTAHFEEQSEALSLADMQALHWALREVDGLVFFNGGKLAGASQKHKHLQTIPLPLSSCLKDKKTPLDAFLASSPNAENSLPFRHAFIRFADPLPEPAALHDTYRQWLQKLRLAAAPGAQPAPYNLLATRRWMMLVPRREERFQGISINALGFAGALLCGKEEQLLTIKKAGPMNVLREAAFPLNDRTDNKGAH